MIEEHLGVCAPARRSASPALGNHPLAARRKIRLEKNGYVKPALLGATYHPENLSPGVLAAYRAPFPTPESRLALLHWSRDIPVEESDQSYAEMKRIEEGLSLLADLPALLGWGMRDPVLPASVLRMWQQKFPNAAVVEIPDASHFLQEGAAELVVRAIQEFLLANR